MKIKELDFFRFRIIAVILLLGAMRNPPKIDEMKSFLLFLTCLMLGATEAKADTVDYCRVYLNKLKVADFIAMGKVVVKIKARTAASSDTLTIFYYTDTPCSDCPVGVKLKSSKGVVLFEAAGRGTSAPLKISVRDLVAKANVAGEKRIEVWYFDRPKIFNRTEPVFRLLLE